jgi:23S rRNA U2552 (ribose-2'-O)-methylase RlmE/FtsJ
MKLLLITLVILFCCVAARSQTVEQLQHQNALLQKDVVIADLKARLEAAEEKVNHYRGLYLGEQMRKTAREQLIPKQSAGVGAKVLGLVNSWEFNAFVRTVIPAVQTYRAFSVTQMRCIQ